MGDSPSARLASLFYEGILSPEAWYSALDETTRQVGGCYFHQIVIDREAQAVVDHVVSAGVPDQANEYEQHYAHRDERLGILAGFQPGQFMYDHDHFDARHRSRSALYTDFLGANGIHDCVAIVLDSSAAHRDEVGLLRAKDAVPFGDDHRQLLQQLTPAMARAARLRAQARTLAQRAALGFAALETLPRALAVVDAHCRVDYCNPSAERLFASQTACHVQAGRLRMGEPAEQDILRQRVARACADVQPAAGVLSVNVGTSKMAISVLPLRSVHALAPGVRPRAMVIFAGPALAARGAVSPHVLAECLGLTVTEGRLATALAHGTSVTEFALQHGCSVPTARTHLRNLLNKTGCHRQVDLVQVVLGMWGGAGS
ncbi:helix-turn-helix transcriptional regulator [Bordetella genomosp. 13]|uniref:helix-turn-helix transcriptional regulator n=1 Tax=Bordetella genomosp. 13 TaxID=463040 RepID=UPI00119CBDC2|nr:helix-turn-helix transcriptional regulator [Bordetella genomosp. 13]